MNVAWYVTQRFHMHLDDICFNIGAENPLLESTVLYLSKTIEEIDRFCDRSTGK